MPRIARIIAPGIPHHVTQRGNRRMETFFRDEDYQAYLSLMAEWCRKYNVAIWAYCLMPNHVHLIAIPETEEGLRLAVGEAHRRYSAMINRRQKWTGHLWQGRFSSFPMDETYLLAAVKYIEMNPVRARLVAIPIRGNGAAPVPMPPERTTCLSRLRRCWKWLVTGVCFWKKRTKMMQRKFVDMSGPVGHWGETLFSTHLRIPCNEW